MKKFKLAILKNELDDDHLLWQKACENYNEQIEFNCIDLTKNDWLEKCLEEKYDFYLAKPPGFSSQYKQLYDERISILSNELNLLIYPSPKEIYIHENKRYFYYWLKANNLPHAETHIFYNKTEAENFINIASYPIVAKFNIGASGSGVKVLINKQKAYEYIADSFSEKGAPKRWGPNLNKGNLLKRGFYYINNWTQIKKKLYLYKTEREDIQKGFVLFQEYIKHNYEWRVVVIGDSFFAHKKLKIGKKASGSLEKNYDNPPLYLFDFVKEIMEKYSFNSQAIDLFETERGELIINEMQCIFGQSDPYQMLVDGIPGRYRFIDNNCIFEAGNFAKNQCYNLRIEHILNILKFMN